VPPLGLVEVQRPRQALENALGNSPEAAAFEPRVVLDADACEQRDLPPPQARYATGATESGQADLVRCEPGATGGEEVANLGAVVHSSKLGTVGLRRRPRRQALSVPVSPGPG
jgi:hypothetical protein